MGCTQKALSFDMAYVRARRVHECKTPIRAQETIGWADICSLVLSGRQVERTCTLHQIGK